MAAVDGVHRRALAAFLSGLAPNLAGNAARRIESTRLGLDALAHVPPPWDGRIGHLIGAATFHCCRRP
jgi:hypothetical protein